MRSAAITGAVADNSVASLWHGLLCADFPSWGGPSWGGKIDVALKGTNLRLRSSILIATSLVGLMLGGCAKKPEMIPAGITSLPPAPNNAASTAPLGDYRLGPLDEFSVTVFREPELSVERVVVDVAGNANLPLAGEIAVLGKTASEVSDEVRRRLNLRYLRDAQVAVAVTRATSYIFTVEGEVERPGTYPIPGRVSLLQAVAIGQGTTDTAKLSETIVFRMVDGQRHAARFDLAAIRNARADDPELQSGDVVVVGFSRAQKIYKDILTVLPGVVGIFVAASQNNGNSNTTPTTTP